MKQWTLLVLAAVLQTALLGQAAWSQPVITDSRIKTLVYNENDVYSLMTHHGYQAHIEFGPKETIRTISVGDKVAWQIIPDGRRVFVRSLIAGAHTNMTVITNERSYQFDLQATKGGKLPVREELVYVVRFFYPDEHIKPTAAGNLPPVYADELVAASTPPESPQLPALNFDYTFTGAQELSPERVFDDGTATYFKLMRPGRIFIVSPDGRDIPVRSMRTSDGFEKVSVVNGRFTVRYEDGSHVCIYNERYAGSTL